MTTTQFFIILGTIYLVPNMEPKFRKWVGFLFIMLAALIEILK